MILRRVVIVCGLVLRDLRCGFIFYLSLLLSFSSSIFERQYLRIYIAWQCVIGDAGVFCHFFFAVWDYVGKQLWWLDVDHHRFGLVETPLRFG